MKIQEAFEDITKWTTYFPGPKKSSKEESTKKKKKTKKHAKTHWKKATCTPGLHNSAQNALFMNQYAAHMEACASVAETTFRYLGLWVWGKKSSFSTQTHWKFSL